MSTVCVTSVWLSLHTSCLITLLFADPSQNQSNFLHIGSAVIIHAILLSPVYTPLSF